MIEKPAKKSKLGPGGYATLDVGSVYLKKFLVTSHGVIMRLSNGLVQVYFKD